MISAAHRLMDIKGRGSEVLLTCSQTCWTWGYSALNASEKLVWYDEWLSYMKLNGGGVLTGKRRRVSRSCTGVPRPFLPDQESREPCRLSPTFA